MFGYLLKNSNKKPQKKGRRKSVQGFGFQDSEEQNVQSEDEEKEQQKVPIFPKPKLMNDVFAKHRHREKKQTKKYMRNKIREEAIQNCKEAFSKRKITFVEKTIEEEIHFQKLSFKQIKYINGNRIQGQWKNGQLHGYAEIQYESGQYFFGQYSYGIRTNGFVRFKDGTEYKGQFQKNAFHGKGSLKEICGRIITCVWEEGEISGKVKVEYTSGDIYYGEMKNMKKHGKGYLFFANGNKYVGNFNEGKISGKGAYYNSEDQLKGEGVWNDGMLEVPHNVQQILTVLADSHLPINQRKLRIKQRL